MRNTSHFISLKGLTGILTGVYSSIGAYLFYAKISSKYTFKDGRLLGDISADLMVYLGLLGLTILGLTLATSIFLSRRKHKKELKLWEGESKFIWLDLLIPLIAGFVLAAALFYIGFNGLVMPVFILFYGLALLNASDYKNFKIKVLGISQVVLGLIAVFNTGYGIQFWTLGFGFFHFAYGILTIRNN